VGCWKLGTTLIGVAVALAVSATVASAGEEVEGGDCYYGDFSVNIMPSCDTTNGGGGNRALLRPILENREPTAD